MGKLLEKLKKIQKERTEQYGNFQGNMDKTASIASVFLNKKITGHDVAMILVALKLSRLSHTYIEDNYLDAISYIEIAEKLKRQEDLLKNTSV